MLYVYILKCSDDSYYTGLTNDLDRRIVEHDEGLIPDCYTWRRRPGDRCREANQRLDTKKEGSDDFGQMGHVARAGCMSE